jgi:hypothetical protein
MSLSFPLIQLGGVYLTDDGLSTGTRYIAEVEGLDAQALTHTIQTTRAIDGTIYSQYQAIKDMPLKIRIPRMDFAKFDAIRDAINTAIGSSTTYALNITANGESFTFTAKPGGLTYKASILANVVEEVEIDQFVTD